MAAAAAAAAEAEAAAGASEGVRATNAAGAVSGVAMGGEDVVSASSKPYVTELHPAGPASQQAAEGDVHEVGGVAVCLSVYACCLCVCVCV